MIIRDAKIEDFEHIIELNGREVLQTSPMDMEKLGNIHAMACYHKIASVNGVIAAFMLAIGNHRPYINDNYNWFASHYSQFIYIDRIVVDSRFCGQGIGTHLYMDLFEYARQQNIQNVVCEYNIEPSNLASKKFHNKFGFAEVGQHHVANGTKLVSLQARQI